MSQWRDLRTLRTVVEEGTTDGDEEGEEAVVDTADMVVQEDLAGTNHTAKVVRRKKVRRALRKTEMTSSNRSEVKEAEVVVVAVDSVVSF